MVSTGETIGQLGLQSGSRAGSLMHGRDLDNVIAGEG